MIDRVNRFVIMLLGLVLTVLGVLGIGIVTDLVERDPLNWNVYEPQRIYSDIVDEIESVPELWWTVILLSIAVITLAGFFWLRGQFRRRGGRGIGRQTLRRSKRGRLDVEPAPVARAVANDLKMIDGVHDAAVRLLEMSPTARVLARIDLTTSAEPQAVRAAAEKILLGVGPILGSESVRADLRIRLATKTSPRVS